MLQTIFSVRAAPDRGGAGLRELTWAAGRAPQNLTGDKTAKARTGAHWERLGFQGADPATDLRDLGMFSLLQMLHLCSAQRLRKTKAIFEFASEREEGTGGRGFPFALLCISLSAIALEALRCGSLVVECNRRGSVARPLNELCLGMLLEFYAAWRGGGLSVAGGDYQTAIEHLRCRALRSPTALLAAARGKVHSPSNALAPTPSGRWDGGVKFSEIPDE